MRLETTDRVYGLQGRFIDMRGKEAFAHLRYIAIWMYLAVAPLVTLTVLAIPRGPGYFGSVTVGVLGGAAITRRLANALSGDTTPRALYEVVVVEARTWLACRLAGARVATETAVRRPKLSALRARPYPEVSS